jgi:ADP-heptose:LPS heptosyltransferase
MRFRGVEAGLRALLVRWAASLQRPPADPAAAVANGPRPILYLRYDRIGDMILATGLLRALATANPPLAVDVLASPENAPVLAGNPNVRSIILFERRRPLSIIRAFRQIRRARYEAVLDCQLYSPSTTTLLMMLASGARRRVGVANRGIDEALTDPMPVPPGAAHTIEYTAALAGAFGIDPVTTDWRPELHLRSDELMDAEAQWGALAGGARTRLLVNISAGKPSCRWPAANVTDLLGALARRAGAVAPAVLLVAAPADLAMAARISAATGATVARTPSIRDALALVAASDVVLTPDTSITHAASALNKPALVLLPRGRDRHWGPYRTSGCAITAPGRWVESLPVAPVLEALDAMLRASNRTVQSTVLEQGTTAP